MSVRGLGEDAAASSLDALLPLPRNVHQCDLPGHVLAHLDLAIRLFGCALRLRTLDEPTGVRPDALRPYAWGACAARCC